MMPSEQSEDEVVHTVNYRGWEISFSVWETPTQQIRLADEQEVQTHVTDPEVVATIRDGDGFCRTRRRTRLSGGVGWVLAARSAAWKSKQWIDEHHEETEVVDSTDSIESAIKEVF